MRLESFGGAAVAPSLPVLMQWYGTTAVCSASSFPMLYMYMVHAAVMLGRRKGRCRVCAPLSAAAKRMVSSKSTVCGHRRTGPLLQPRLGKTFEFPGGIRDFSS